MATPATARLDTAAQPPARLSKTKVPSQFWQGVLTLLFVAVLVWKGMYSADAQSALLWSFGLITAYCILLGQWILKDPLGILINERNLMSLSRMQTVLWTFLIFSGFLTFALQRIHAGPEKYPDALDIKVDPKLWAVLGISFGSLVGTPMVLNSKKDQEPSNKAVLSAAKALDESPNEITKDSQGTLYSNASPRDAVITDMFQGDEIGNTSHVDVAKLQMFFFTLALVLAYGAQLYNALANVKGQAPALAELPSLSANAVTLLGISHVGYLTSKAVDHTPTTPSQN